MNPCTHFDNLPAVTRRADGCEECLATGDWWVHLRMCLVCGHVGCCDDSKNKHARQHFHQTGHAVVKSLEPWEEWEWCFVDRVFKEKV